MIEAYTGLLNDTLIPRSSNLPRVVDLFAGCGGLALGFEAQGFETIGYEMDAKCSATYLGDTSKKLLHLDQESLKKINFFDLAHDELPDVVSYSESKNWLYLIEAVHSSGPISNLRHEQLKALTKRCTAEIIYVTAFLDKETFRKYAPDIAWKTEVWIAEAPDHIIHFDGKRFLGPYANQK